MKSLTWCHLSKVYLSTRVYNKGDTEILLTSNLIIKETVQGVICQWLNHKVN